MKKFMAVLLFVLFFSLTSNIDVGFAAEGDFYNKYKSDIDSISHAPNYTEVLKKYDSETKSFECGKFDIYCLSTSAQLGVGIGLMNFVMVLFQYMIIDPNWILNEPIFTKYKGYFDSLTYSLLALFFIWQIAVNYAKNLTQIEEMDQFLNQKIIQIVGAVFLLVTYDEIFGLILSVQYDITSAVLKLGINEDQFTILVMKYQNMYSILFSLILGIVFLVFIIAILYRFVAFGFFYIMGPIAIVTMPNEEFNYFSLWFKYIINNVVTLFTQCLCLSLAVSAITLQFGILKRLPGGVDIVFGIVLCGAFCIFALVIPMILGQLGASTGTGKSLAKMMRFVAMKR